MDIIKAIAIVVIVLIVGWLLIRTAKEDSSPPLNEVQPPKPVDGEQVRPRKNPQDTQE